MTGCSAATWFGGIYAVIGFAWILASDTVAESITVGNAEALALLQASKGFVFVSVSAVVIFAVVRANSLRVLTAHDRLSEAYDQTLAGWAAALDIRDHSTARHTQRVTEITVALAQELGIDGADLVHLRRGAMLHDIGKMGVPDSILSKPGPLTDEEWALMRQHPRLAMDMLAGIDHLRPALDIPWCHHERWDGRGYPRGLQGPEIPLAARLFSIVDVYDAVTNVRPYRSPMSHDDALLLIHQGAGSQFDPDVVTTFLRLAGAPSFEREHAIS